MEGLPLNETSGPLLSRMIGTKLDLLFRDFLLLLGSESAVGELVESSFPVFFEVGPIGVVEDLPYSIQPHMNRLMFPNGMRPPTDSARCCS